MSILGKVIELSAELRQRVDGWANLATGLGTSRDKRLQHRIYRGCDLSDEEAADIYRSTWLGRKSAEKLPSEAMRQGVTLVKRGATVEEAQKLQDDGGRIIAAAKAQGVFDKVLDARIWGRVFGGGAIFLGVRGGGNLTLPLADDQVKGLAFLEVYDRRELFPVRWYENPRQPKYGEPSHWRLQPRLGGTVVVEEAVVHESRLLMFGGARTGKFERFERNGFDDSVYRAAYQTLRDGDGNWQSVCHLMTDLSQAIFKLHGLTDLIAAKEEDAVRTRMQLLEEGRSVVRAVLLDPDHNEDFERKQTPLQNVPELLDRSWQVVAAAFDMPVTELMGIASAGLNSTGENEMKKWYNTVAVEREYLTPRIERVLKFIARTEGIDESGWGIEWPSLFQPTDKEVSEARLNDARADALRIKFGMNKPTEITDSRWGRGQYGINIILDPSIRDREIPPGGLPPAGGLSGSDTSP